MINRKKTIIMMTDMFSASSGGRTASIFRRAKIYQELGYRVCIATKNYRPNYLDIFEFLCAKFGVKNATFLNPFEFFAGEKIYKLHDQDAALAIHGIVDEPTPYSVINSDADGKAGRRQTFRLDGEGSRVLSSQTFYVPDTGRVYMYSEPGIKGGIARVVWCRKNGKKRYFRNMQSAQEYWIADLAREYGDPVFIAEDHTNPDLLIRNRFTDRKLKVIMMVHSTIFEEPYDYNAPMREYYEKALENIDRYSAVIALTDQEKDHIANYYGSEYKIRKIHHPIETMTTSVKTEKQDNLIVLCCRLDPIKRVDHSIRAIALVAEKIPNVKLRIYGNGEDLDHCMKIVEECGVGKNVEFMGFTDEPLSKIAAAKLTLSTSCFEGLPLQIQEALHEGTPVISYDYMYGPREMIRNGENGYIVENGNIEALADKIVAVLKDPALARRLSDGARNIRTLQSESEIRTEWRTLLGEIDNMRVEETDDLVRQILVKQNYIRTAKGSKCWHLELAVSFVTPSADEIRYYVRYNRPDGLSTDNSLWRTGAVSSNKKGTDTVKFEVCYSEADFNRMFGSDGECILEVCTSGRCWRFPVEIDKDGKQRTVLTRLMAKRK